MNYENIIRQLSERFSDEIHDANHYYTLAMDANLNGYTDMACHLYEIACDEFTHAKYIHMVMMQYGCPIDDTAHKSWHALNERFNM